MKAPIHPHERRDFKAPAKFLSMTRDVELKEPRTFDNMRHAWDEERARLGQDKSISQYMTVGEPHVVSSWQGIALRYKLTYDNPNYDAEVAEEKAEIQKYLEDNKLYADYQETLRRKARQEFGIGIDAKIEKAKRRLANLLATKADEPLPYPDTK